MSSGAATVKAVLSGDTLALMGRATTGPPPEIQLTLSSLMAPKMARNKDAVEEAFALESREFLRKLCIGKQVTFRIEYTVAAIGRTFGAVYFNDENLCVTIAREGWARVKPLDPNREGQHSCDYEAMVAAAQQAEAARKGVYGPPPALIPTLNFEQSGEPVLRKFGTGVPVPVVIEHVRDGAFFKCMVPGDYYQFVFALTGVVCPRVNSSARAGSGGGGRVAGSGGGGYASAAALPAEGSENGETNGQGAAGGGGGAGGGQSEPFALEAKHFSEVRLLNRDVDVVFEGLDKNTVVGTIIHPMGNVSVELLRHGLGRMSDYTSGLCLRPNAIAMRQAENEAKSQRLRIWRSWTPPQIQGEREFTATVVEVVSGDQIVLSVSLPDGRKEERRVYLSSVRAPRSVRVKRGSGGGAANEDEPWAYEARESLRSKVIGKTVRVVTDYDREIKVGDTESVRRPFCSVFVGKGRGKNVSEALIAEGVVSLAKHRVDEPKSSEYDRLMAAEADAKAAKKGMYGAAAPAGAPRLLDLSIDQRRSKEFFPNLKRHGPTRAMVEFVYNGARFKICVQRENALVNMAISGIRCPQTASMARPGYPARAAEPMAEEARLFSREHALQRAVEVEIIDMDKVGTALGHVWVGQGEERHLYAKDLLRMGLARADERALNHMSNDFAMQYRTAEAEAKQAGLGVWAMEEANAAALAAEERAAAAAAAAESEPAPVQISEIVDASSFYVQKCSDKAVGVMREIEGKMRQLAEAHGTVNKGAPVELRRGTMCAALFDAGSGSAWYRARIISAPTSNNNSNNGSNNGSNNSVRVIYIDHGNVATVPPAHLLPLDSSYFRTEPQAIECSLALLTVPSLEADHGRDAAMVVNDYFGSELVMRMLGRDENRRPAVALYTSADVNGETVNERLVREGLARFNKRALSSFRSDKAQELAVKLKDAQEEAHKARVNLWRYGDVGSDDEES